MIKPQELRIGNFIDRNGMMEVKDIKASGKIRVYDHHNRVELRYYLDAETFKGIPLTPQWLERGGFEKVNDYRYQSYDYLIEVMMNDDKVVRIRQSDNESWPLATIKHVHHLQNLYYALTGKELTFKPA